MDNPTELTLSDVSLVTKTLLGNNAYTIADNIEGANKFGTGPVRSAYIAMCHTDLTSDLERVDRFRHKNDYPSANEALDSEWGAIGNIRFLVSSIGSKLPNASNRGRDVYNIFVSGLQAYGCVEQDGMSASFIYRPAIYDGPLALNISVGYKFAEVSRILNDAWLIKLQATLMI